VPLMKKIRSLFAVLALVIGLTVAVQSPAFAAWSGCSALPNRVCTYWDEAGTGAVYFYTGPINTCIDIGEPWDEDISSVWNRFNHAKVYFYVFSDSCSGFRVVVDHDVKKNYGPDPYLNDSFNSLIIVPI
jgi:hypothetical protein